ncbi:hypothetical protein J6590_075244 [Homalodisca vitripennis]|nr:hypothetical protein J6590_075244 [Homalodisca vitripennis]
MRFAGLGVQSPKTAEFKPLKKLYRMSTPSSPLTPPVPNSVHPSITSIYSCIVPELITEVLGHSYQVGHWLKGSEPLRNPLAGLSSEALVYAREVRNSPSAHNHHQWLGRLNACKEVCLAVTQPSSNHARRCLISNNSRTRYTWQPLPLLVKETRTNLH